MKKTKGCIKCDFIYKTFYSISDMTSREYWIMTEIFVYLHKGKDYCNEYN